jgi:hypothetical protein
MTDKQRPLETPSWLRSLAQELAAVPGVAGVVLGGSRARSRADAKADFDVGVYYHEADFDWPSVMAIATRWDDGDEPRGVGAPGQWGPWMNGGAWLQVEGRQVDLLLREYGFVKEVIAECRSGRCRADYQLGHPGAWHNHMLVAEVHHNVILHDKGGLLAGLHAMTTPYPEALRQTVLRRFMFEALFTANLVDKAAAREEPYYTSGLVFRLVSSVVQVLYALNREYFVNEKGSVAEADSFALRPDGFAARIRELIPLAVSEYEQGARDARRLVDEVGALVLKQGVDYPRA